MPQCSVIIPVYNHSKYLIQRIESILTQTFQDFELIILDDFSTDDSCRIIEKYKQNPKISHIVFNSENSGSPFCQWTKGIMLAKGDWIWIAESDDYSSADFLETAFSDLNKCPEAGIFFSDTIYDTNDGNPYRFLNSSDFKNNYFKTDKWSKSYCISGIKELNSYLKFICTIINASSAIFKKQHLLSIIENLQRFKYHGDWYCMVALALTSNICYSEKKMNYCRMHQYNFLNTIYKKKSKIEYFLILEKLVNSSPITEKNKLIRFFTIQYIGFGIFSDGITQGMKLIRSYYKIDSALCMKFLTYLFLQKITFTKRKTIY